MADFRRLQRELTAHLRDPEAHAPPVGLDDRRLAIYRRLVYKNLDRFLGSCFPVLRRLVDDAVWAALVRDYLRRHRARTPLFPRIPREFVQYLEQADVVLEGLPFLRELAYYEWLEIEAGQDPREVDDARIDAGADPFMDLPVLNPLARARAFVYPVHRLGPDFRPPAPPEVPTYLVVFRKRSDEIGFMELNPVSARLIELILLDEGMCGRDLLARIADELRHPAPEVVIAGGRALLDDLLAREILAGARRAGPRGH